MRQFQIHLDRLVILTVKLIKSQVNLPLKSFQFQNSIFTMVLNNWLSLAVACCNNGLNLNTSSKCNARRTALETSSDAESCQRCIYSKPCGYLTLTIFTYLHLCKTKLDFANPIESHISHMIAFWNHNVLSTTKWGSLRGVSKLRKVLHAKMITLQYSYQKLLNVEHRHVGYYSEQLYRDLGSQRL